MIFLIISLAVFLLFTPAAEAISVSGGEHAPGFTLSSVEGKTISLSDYKGRVAVLVYWRTGQKRSLLALKDINDILKKFKGKNVQVATIIAGSDNREEAVNIFTENRLEYPLLIDSDRQLYGDYGIRVFPSTVIIDRKGIVAYAIPGHPLTYKTRLRGFIKKALGEINESELEKTISPHREKKDKAVLEALRLYNLALRFTDSGLLDMAINAAIKSVEAKPEMIGSHILLGFLYLEMKEADKALESFNKAIKLAPQSNDAKTGLGGALILKGDIDRAIEILDDAAVANPYPQMTYYELGKAYELKGEKDKSIEMYKKAIKKIIDKQILPSSISRCK